MRVRNKKVLALLMPVALLFWMVGWIFYLKGHSHKLSPVENGKIEIIAALPEEYEALKM